MRLIIYGGNLLAAVLGLTLFLVWWEAANFVWLAPLTAGIYGAVCFWFTSPSNFARSEVMTRWHLNICALSTIALITFGFPALVFPGLSGLALVSITALLMSFLEYIVLLEAFSSAARKSGYDALR